MARREPPSGSGERQTARDSDSRSVREPSVEAVRRQLEKILASKGFAHSERLNRFLRFIIEQTIEGRGNQIKEYLLGVEVFGKDESFDPRIDTLVRVEAHRLRARLKAYYAAEGRDDPILIDLPKGAYAPVFRRRVSGPGGWLRNHWKVSAAVGVMVLAALGVYWAIHLGKRQHVPETEAPSAPASIAVLPFADLSPEKDQEYFCDGITDELINTLAQVPGLRVVSRTSTFAFKGKPQDVRQIGRQLNVRVVLEGSVRKIGDQMRVTAQLASVADGYHLWSKTYEGNLRDVFAIQDEISRAIVSALRVQLVGEGRTLAGKRHSDNPDAYHLYLKGRYQWNKRTEEGLKKGIEYFEQAIAADPDYALAYVGVADCYAMLASYGVSPPREVMPKAKQAAAKALQMDDALAEACASLGLVKSFFDWDWLGAEQEYKRAIELNPNYATAHQWYSGCLRAMGRLDEALAEIRKAEELDPLSLVITRDVGRVYRLRRQHDLAIEQYRKALELEPDFPSAYLHLGLEYQATLQRDKAVATLEKGRSLSGANPLMTGGLGYCYASLGRTGEALRLLEELKQLSKKRYVSPITPAMIYIGMGRKDQAFEALEQAYEERDRWLAWLKVDPIFDSLRSDPRFGNLVRRVGLP